MLGTSLRTRVFGDEGFSTDLILDAAELDYLRAVVEDQWLDTIGRSYPALRPAFAELGIARYHEKAALLDHKALWPKAARLMPEAAVGHLRTMGFFRHLTAAFGELQISDEEPIGWPAVYWRLVRPFAAGDYGPLHADAWFWDLGNGVTPPEMLRVKVWIPLHTERGLNGLRVVPGSHRRQWRYHAEVRDGYVKPCIDEDEAALNPRLLPTAPGQAVVFHDLLIHGGSFNKADSTRVSVEFTLFVHEAVRSADTSLRRAA